jgi:hypothetical protein
MKHYLLALFASVFFTFPFSGTDSRATDALFENGFSGLRWGAEISSLPDFESFRKQDEVEYFRTPDKVYTIFDVDVENVVFGFHQKEFFAAYVQIRSLDVYGKLKQRLTQAYGNPKMKLVAKTEQTIYRWKSKDVKVKLKVDEIDGLMKLGVYYSPISEKVNEKASDLYFDDSPKFFPVEKDKQPERIPILRF